MLKNVDFWRVLASAMIGIAVAEAFCDRSNWRRRSSSARLDMCAASLNILSEQFGQADEALASNFGAGRHCGRCDQPLRIGIGIHCGAAIVGEMGYGNAAAITAIGDAVNTASRLESLTKNFACELVVSEKTVSRAGLDLSAFPQREIEIRGRREMLAVRTLTSAAELPAAGAAPIRRIELASAMPSAPRQQAINIGGGPAVGRSDL